MKSYVITRRLALLAITTIIPSVASIFALTVWSQDTADRMPVQLPGLQRSGATLLPNGWSIRPVGEQIDMGDFPCHMEVSPDGAFAAILHAGWGTHEIRLVSIVDRKVTSSVTIDQSFQGLRFSEDGHRLYVSGAEDECVYVYDHRRGYLTFRERIQLTNVQDKNVVAGLIEAQSGKTLIACGLMMHQVLIADLTTVQKDLNANGTNVEVVPIPMPPNSYPIDVIVSPDGTRAMVSLWGKASVAVIDLATKTMVGEWQVRSHPTEMRFLDNGKRLLVGCTDDNTVVMLNTETGNAEEVIRTSLYATTKNGSTPNSLAVTPDEKVLLVANADNNNLAVFDIQTRGQSKSLGFIPVGWYPTSVRFSADGEQIMVTNGKGLASRDNVKGPNPLQEPAKNVREYIGGLFKGTLSVIPAPSPNLMARWTKEAYAVSPFRSDEQPNLQTLAGDSSIPGKVGDPSPIKHCFYIIKENRTYDQVFGDVEKGNGDASLCIFPDRITPNHHALANEFVLLDNFYVESEVSADGHEWSMAAYATDFVERAWPLNYRGNKGKIGYTSEGGYAIAYPSSGYIWDQCKKANVSYFSFGEFIQNPKVLGEPGKARVPSLDGHFDPLYRSYDLDYMDVDRVKRFRERFAEFDAQDNLPQFVVLRIGNDHTTGTRVGKKTPIAMVADNDLALGQIVEIISHSRYWNQSAIFVVEDDAQNGSDHVDAHRTVALAISPYIRKGTVDSTLYSTSSMLRSMELILGMPPMTQFDAAANPMYRSFGNSLDPQVYNAKPAQVDLYETNSPLAWGADLSEQLDLSREDAADDLLLGEIVWRSVRGPNSKMPPPVRAAFVFTNNEQEEEEEEKLERKEK